MKNPQFKQLKLNNSLSMNTVMTNKMFDHEPENWQQLEEMVYSAFIEMGYESHRNYSVKTVRGDVAIDVYATDKRTSIPTVVICECKYWNKRINQQVIYAFRSICSDIGAHYGLVISKVGFQKGAEQTRDCTNVHLLDFNQFQEKFFDKWREGVFMKIVEMRDSFLPKMYSNVELVEKAVKKYALFERVSDHFIIDRKFPINIVDPRGNIESEKRITIKSHRQYFEIAKEAHTKLK